MCKILKIAFSLSFPLLFNCAVSKKSMGDSPKKYNIVLIVADDLGRNDLACYGNSFIETPRLNGMAKDGILFKNGYAAAPLCSPSRASIITGNNPTRINLTEHLHGYAPPSPKQKTHHAAHRNGLTAATYNHSKSFKINGLRNSTFWQVASRRWSIKPFGTRF